LTKKLNEHNVETISYNLEGIYKKQPIVGIKYLTNIATWKLGLKTGFKLFNFPDDIDLILFEGGGYMNDLWYGFILLNEVLRRCEKPIVVAPHSYWFKGTEIISMLDVELQIILFCRELYSQDLLVKLELPENVNIQVSKDTALYLDKEDLQSLIFRIKNDYDLICFRKDKESHVSEKCVNEIVSYSDFALKGDISKRKDLKYYLSTIANARKIFTDRLHVGIAAHILDKEATLFSGKYFKNKGVYEYSLKSKKLIKFIQF
jgi:exopolysaccharide biosynthesis predicted pyruvyltransferase EpsI